MGVLSRYRGRSGWFWPDQVEALRCALSNSERLDNLVLPKSFLHFFFFFRFLSSFLCSPCFLFSPLLSPSY